MRKTSLLAAAAMIAAVSVPPSLSAAQPRGEDRLARMLDGRVAGKPVDCISLHAIRSTEIIDGTAIVYRANGNRLYINRPENGARWLRRDDILLTKPTGSQLCSIDTVRLIDRGSHFPRGFVALGRFVPYLKAGPRG